MFFGEMLVDDGYGFGQAGTCLEAVDRYVLEVDDALGQYATDRGQFEIRSLGFF